MKMNIGAVIIRFAMSPAQLLLLLSFLFRHKYRDSHEKVHRLCWGEGYEFSLANLNKGTLFVSIAALRVEIFMLTSLIYVLLRTSL